MKKKYRLKKWVKVVIGLIIAIVIIINSSFYKRFLLKQLNYQDETISYIMDNKLEKKVLKNKYNKVLEKSILSKTFKEERYDIYYLINDYDITDFALKIDNLLNKGYNAEELNALFSKYSDEDYTYLSSLDDKIDILSLLNVSYYRIGNLKRYNNYISNKDNKITDSILEVNMNLDYDFYTNTKDVIQYDEQLLVNKYYNLLSTYVPDDLVLVSKEYSNKTSYLTKNAYDAFLKLVNDMEEDGLSIIISSGYRSYNYQKKLYDSYVANYGKAEADNVSARPGHSEHQTGLAMDVASKDTPFLKFATTKEYQWMLDNCHRYGFILRYQPDKEYITGYSFESWHYRYVGTELATILFNEKITLEEYLAQN